MKTIIIQNREVDSELWEDWADDMDAMDLLTRFVSAVSCEEVDDVNRYWRVISGTDLQVCDNCGNTVIEGDGFFVYSELPFDIDSADKGESGLVCKGCNEELTAEAEAA